MSRIVLLAIAWCLTLPTGASAREDENQESRKPGDVNGTRTISLETRKQFACGEVYPERSGGFLRHEINITPGTIERCDLKKVGSRLHDCEKLNINVATSNVHQVNTVYTDGGIVQFWFEDNANIDTADRTGALIFTWPSTDSRYICLPFE